MFKRKGGAGGSKAFWTMFKKTALFWKQGIPKGSRPKNGLCTVRLIVRVDPPAPLRHPDRKKTVFWMTFLMWFSAGMIRWQKHKVKMNPMLGYQRENRRRKEPWRSNRPTAERNLQRLPQVGTFLYHYLSLSKTAIWEGSSTIKTSFPRISMGTIIICCHQKDCCPREWEVWSWARCSSEIENQIIFYLSVQVTGCFF